MRFDANALFEAELARRGLTFSKEDDLVYQIQVGGWDLSVNLDNARRNAERDQDPGVITRFVENILGFSGRHPEWDEASTLLFWSAQPADSDFGASIHVAVTDTVSRVLTLSDAERTRVTWVTPSMCHKWGVTVDQACSLAASNQNRLLEGLKLETAHGDDVSDTLGMIPLHPPYKASTIFASAFKNLVEPVLGWPVLVVLPCRDFVYVIAETSTLLESLGPVVVEEFRNSGHPITTEVLRISDDGIEAIGHFPPEGA
ncbi:MAG TPA: hypothetical protein VM686_07635 [Polyangiaceae bacterium]|nr:hypothetical protein [Polyangiaceae bacterium]